MITVNELTKRYGAFTAVDRICFEVRPGRVVGFLGPNGAGKSTAMRMLVGLTPPTSGSAQILGRRYVDLPNPGREVGVLLDASAQHPGRTGREVLLLGAQLMGVGRTRVEETLALVGLSAAESRRRVRDYSLGMRQRLGIGHALLGDPQVLILDEPANGLDPDGIAWIRGLLRGFADRGGAVLVSSHLLREVEAVADEVVIINRGRIMAQGGKAELQAAAARLEGARTLVVAAQSEALQAALVRAGLEVSWAPGGGLVVSAGPTDVSGVAAQAGILITELRPVDGSGLEELFFELTADDARQGLAA